MKLSLKDIKTNLQRGKKTVRPQSQKFQYFIPRELDLSPYRLADEFWLIPDYITSELENQILQQGVYTQPNSRWVRLRTRTLQMWGGQITPQGLTNKEALPRWLDIFCQRLFDQKVHPFKANHVLINEYRRGEGIMPHTDGPAYYPIVAILSLSSSTTFTFWNDIPRTPEFSVIIPQRSLFIFTGNLYYNKLHGIEAVGEDQFFADSCGVFYKIQDWMSPVVNFCQQQEPFEEVIGRCPVCQGELKNVSNLNRENRVSFTIRYAPLKRE